LLYISVGQSGEAEIEALSGEGSLTRAGSTCCVLWRMHSARLSYVEIVTPTDLRNLVVSLGTNGELIASWQLFAEFLEKGVIRRARVHGALLPRKNDVELAIECCRAIQQSPLPLTT
jgi:hypothetical protein